MKDRSSSLPTDAKQRKEIPIATGFVDYFPSAIAAVAELSRIGGEQHNPGKPLHWDRSKSGDESDALMRHFLQRGTIDTDGVRHSAKVAWRALALLEKEIESADGGTVAAPGDDGWIYWNGGECPVDGATFVYVQFRGYPASNRACPAGELRWYHNGNADVLRYRIAE